MPLYERLVLRHPVAVLVVLGLLLLTAAAQFPKIRLDASADSLLLQGDPDLKYFREVSGRYSAEEFIVITWRPEAPLLSDDSLEPLGAMAAELRLLEGVSSVVTVLDVPLLQSPPIGLGRVTSDEPLPTLRDPETDRALALQEFTTSPLYRDLLVGAEGDVTAVQVNIKRQGRDDEQLRERGQLRRAQEAGDLDAAGEKRLDAVEAAVAIRAGVERPEQAGRRVLPAGEEDESGGVGHESGDGDTTEGDDAGRRMQSY